MTTQFASAHYQEIVDLHTESDTVSVIGIHTPQGDTPRKMFGGFFDQFKKFKYLGCSIKLVPAARLPADPLQVSAQYDDFQTIDPRDMLNPLMFHGCHGNDMGVILNRLYALNSGDRTSDSVNFIQNDIDWSLDGIAAGKFPNFQLEDLYYKALTDNTWKKAHPQRGFRKSGLRPLVYKMATNLQMLGTGQSLSGEVGVDGIPMGPVYSDGEIVQPVTQAGRQFFTPGLTGLGWLDTRNVLTDYQKVDIDLPIDESEIPDLELALRTATLAQQNNSEAALPLVYMGMILLPPAYKTEQYFRMIINHHFAFKDFRGISFSNNLSVTPAYSDFNNEEDVDPDDPTPGPSPDPEPDPPLSGATVLTGFTDRGTVQFGNIIYDRFSTIQYEDNVDYSPQITNLGTPSKSSFIVSQADVNNQTSNPEVGFCFSWDTAQEVILDNMDVVYVTYVAIVDGSNWVFVPSTQTRRTFNRIAFPNGSPNATWSTNPVNSELNGILGSAIYTLEEVSYDV